MNAVFIYFIFIRNMVMGMESNMAVGIGTPSVRQNQGNNSTSENEGTYRGKAVKVAKFTVKIKKFASGMLGKMRGRSGSYDLLSARETDKKKEMKINPSNIANDVSGTRFSFKTFLSEMTRQRSGSYTPSEPPSKPRKEYPVTHRHLPSDFSPNRAGPVRARTALEASPAASEKVPKKRGRRGPDSFEHEVIALKTFRKNSLEAQSIKSGETEAFGEKVETTRL
jgi:hypothetical protein